MGAMTRSFLSLYATRRDDTPIGETYGTDLLTEACQRASELDRQGWLVTLSRVHVAESVTRVDFRKALKEGE
jgi:hypothetical protein